MALAVNKQASPAASAGHAGDAGLISVSGGSPDTPVFLSGEPMDIESWQATVHGVSESDTPEVT